MSQQPYYPQQQPPQPNPYAQPAYPQAYPVQQPQPYPQVQQGYPGQAYGQPQQPPAVPLANGGLDEFYSQPNLGGGKGLSWKGKPDGYTVQGVVARDVTHADVSQEVGAPGSPDQGRPKFYRDGRPMFVLAIPLQVPPQPDHPDGEARLYIRGQLRDELTRAMVEAGIEGAGTPAAQIKGGTTITVTLVERKQGQGTIPKNIFRVIYTPPGMQPPAIQQPVPQQQFQQQPYGQQAMQQQGYAPQPPVQQYQQAPPMQQQYQQPVQQQTPVGAGTAPTPPAPAVQQPAQQGQQEGQPGQQQMQVPPGFDQNAINLLAQLTNQQPQG